MTLHARGLLLAVLCALFVARSEAQDPAPEAKPTVEVLEAKLAKEPDRRARAKLVEALGAIKTPAARRALALRALTDADHEVRYTALDGLEKGDALAADAFVAALRSSDNRVVNNAAEGLKYLADPAAVEPLIDALVTTHQFNVVVPRRVVFRLIGAPPAEVGEKHVVTQLAHNQKVLDALVTLTGENFQFNVNQWKLWKATQKARAARPG